MASKSDVPQAIVTLLSRDANSNDGLTIKQISEQLDIAYPTAARWIKQLPGISKSLRPVYPNGFWFDVTKAIADSEKEPDLPETFFGPLPGVRFFPKNPHRVTDEEFIAALNSIDTITEGLKDTHRAIDAALGNARAFAEGNMPLDEDLQRTAHNKMVAARRSLERYCELYAGFQDDPRFQTPEYWTVYLSS